MPPTEKTPPPASAPKRRNAPQRKAGEDYAATPEHRRVNRIVRLLLAAQSMQKQELADALCVSPSAISSSLTGDRSWRLEDLQTMAEVLEVQPAIWFADPQAVKDSLLPEFPQVAKVDIEIRELDHR